MICATPHAAAPRCCLPWLTWLNGLGVTRRWNRAFARLKSTVLPDAARQIASAPARTVDAPMELLELLDP